MNLNKVFLVGRVTKDPEIKSLPSGVQVANFGMATNRVYNDKNGQKHEETEFHSIVFFGNVSKVVANYVFKGSEILVEGRLVTRSWDKKEGGKAYKTEIMGERLQLGAKPKSGSGPNPKEHGGAEKDEYPVVDLNSDEIESKDLPF